MTTTAPALPDHRLERRARISELTQAQTLLYAQLQTNGEERDRLVLAEMNEVEQPAVARELAEIMGVSVGRIYKLRDNAKARS